MLYTVQSAKGLGKVNIVRRKPSQSSFRGPLSPVAERYSRLLLVDLLERKVEMETRPSDRPRDDVWEKGATVRNLKFCWSVPRTFVERGLVWFTRALL